MIFVDTSAWYARFAARDAGHDQAVAFLAANRDSLYTTDYVLDESLTLFRARGFDQWACYLGRLLLTGQLATLVYISPEDVEAAWRLFDSHRDKQWSFTDCTSYVVMRRMGITEAFAMDDHFRQFGFAIVRP
ncbi:MAG TPA: PIN domain-containing protein [Lacipirellulaceae bacterium]|nr:PIN domain-containing protein [Lacipirellulaceae bacterium]